MLSFRPTTRFERPSRSSFSPQRQSGRWASRARAHWEGAVCDPHSYDPTLWVLRRASGRPCPLCGVLWWGRDSEFCSSWTSDLPLCPKRLQLVKTGVCLLLSVRPSIPTYPCGVIIQQYGESFERSSSDCFAGLSCISLHPSSLSHFSVPEISFIC